MPVEDARAMAARYRETAEALKGMAEKIRFDPRRRNQLRSLADGFDRAAERIEKGLPKDQVVIITETSGVSSFDHFSHNTVLFYQRRST